MSKFVQHSKKNETKKDMFRFRNTYGSVSKSGMHRTSHHFQTAEPCAEPGETKTTRETKEPSKCDEVVSSKCDEVLDDNEPVETATTGETKESSLFDDKSKKAKEKLMVYLDEVHKEGEGPGRKTYRVLANIGGNRVTSSGTLWGDLSKEEQKKYREKYMNSDETLTFKGGTNYGPYDSIDKASKFFGLTSTAYDNVNIKIRSSKVIQIGQIEAAKGIRVKFIKVFEPEKKFLGKVYTFLSSKVTGNVESDRKKYKELSKKEKETLDSTDSAEQRNLTYQICKYMIDKGMVASKNVIDDNGGFIEDGFKFRTHGGLFAPSFDRIKNKDNGFYRLHFPNLKNALENINIVAKMTNLRFRASKLERKTRRAEYENKSEQKRQDEFKEILTFSQKPTYNVQRANANQKSKYVSTPLYEHANNIWAKEEDECQKSFPDSVEQKKREEQKKKREEQKAAEAATMLKEEKEREAEAKKNINKMPLANMGGFEGGNMTVSDDVEKAETTVEPSTKKKIYNKGFHDYWRYLLELLKEQKGICAVGRYPMSLESGPWLVSPDAINPVKGHIRGNVRLVCICNNPTDSSKTLDMYSTSKNNIGLEPLPTSQTPEIHDTYWYTINC